MLVGLSYNDREATVIICGCIKPRKYTCSLGVCLGVWLCWEPKKLNSVCLFSRGIYFLPQGLAWHALVGFLLYSVHLIFEQKQWLYINCRGNDCTENQPHQGRKQTEQANECTVGHRDAWLCIRWFYTRQIISISRALVWIQIETQGFKSAARLCMYNVLPGARAAPQTHMGPSGGERVLF